MALIYDNLWNLIEKRGISKTEFRKLVGISTVSLAKLSKNEPVTLNIIEQICQTLKCEISEVVSVVPRLEDKKWERIREEDFYSLNLYFLVEKHAGQDAIVQYLYGFGIAYGIEIEEHKSWLLEEKQKQDTMGLWEVSNTVKGEVLLEMINSVDQNMPFGLFLKKLGHEMRNGSKTAAGKEIREIMLSKTIFPGAYLYRQPFFLTPERESADIRTGMQPFHSFGDKPMLCEALVSQKKRELYYNMEGSLDSLKMQFIYDFFRKEGFLVNGFRDISRIGDFEVFYPLFGDGNRKFFEIETIKKESNDRKIRLLGYKVTVYAAELEGEYAMEIIVSGTVGVAAHKIFRVVLHGQDITKEIMLEESAGTIEVRLFDLNSDAGIQMIAWEKTSIIMEIHLRMNVLEKKATLVSRKRKHKNITSRQDIELYSGEEFKVGGDDKSSQDWKYADVYEDFNKLYGENKAETYLFPAHDEQNSFVNWLQRKIIQNYKNEIWLFDPYIDEKVMPKLLSLVKSLETTLHIVTCFHDQQKKQDEARVARIKQFCKEAEKIMGTMEIAALTGHNGQFHDRVIMMFGNDFYPEVFSMSNSLDSMGENFSSIATKLDRLAGAKVSEEYLNKYFDASTEGTIEILREKEAAAPVNGRDDFVLDTDIKKILLDAGAEELFEEAKKSLQLYETQRNVEKVFLTVTMEKEFRICLEQMKSYYKYCYENELQQLPVVIRQLLRKLLEKSYDKYMELFRSYSKEPLGMTALQIHRAMLELLCENLRGAVGENILDTAGKYLQSDEMEAVALGAVCLMDMDEMELLCCKLADRKDYMEECYREKIIQLQVEDCRKHYRSKNNLAAGNVEKMPVSKEVEEFNSRLEDAKQAWINLMAEDLSEDVLEYKFRGLAVRSVQDVCEMTLSLVSLGKISRETAGSYLIKCLFAKIEKEYKKEDGFWRGQDFQDAAVYIMAIEQCTGREGRRQILEKYAAWEKKLVRTLQDVFLEKRNYRRWKTCIDSLLWCMTMRGFCRINWRDYDSVTEDTNLISRETEMRGIIRKSKYKLEEYSEAYRIWEQNACGFSRNQSLPNSQQ